MKKLIIVCEEKLRQFGDYLAQLISLDDDTEEQIIGTKDGAVVAQVWTEKDYKSNEIQISSEQYILFIGNSKLMQKKRLHMQRQFSEFGMKYSWLGKQGVLFIDRISSLEDYDKFFEYAKTFQPKIKRIFDQKAAVNKLPKPNKADYGSKPTIPKKGLAPIKEITTNIAKVKTNWENMVLKTANSKNVEKQQYSCLVYLFYLNDLNVFLSLAGD